MSQSDIASPLATGGQKGGMSRPDSQVCSTYAGRRVLVMGLGRFGGGAGVTRWLAEQGASVTVADQAQRDSLADSLAALADLNIQVRLGQHQESDLDDIDVVIVNPAVKKAASPFFQAIHQGGIAWTTEMNLFCERCPAPVVAVTGTFGKSTTCAMLTKVLEDCSETSGFTKVRLGGNIGRSLLNELPEIRPSDIVVLEMSNAQLEDIPRILWSPKLAVITNLFPHHLDRYASKDEYFAAKLNLLCNADGPEILVVGELHARAEAMLNDCLAGRRARLVRVRDTGEISLFVPGRHNRANAACVRTVCREIGLPDDAVLRSLQSFRGLEHRLEFVREDKGVAWYNDSKSTAPPATMVAIEALIENEAPPDQHARNSRADSPPPGRLICIVGGQAKDVSFGDCAALLARACAAVVCMGEDGSRMAGEITRANADSPSPRAEVCKVSDLPQAVENAQRIAQPGDIVLFSPGAPSFDQYTNFTQRGKHFVALVIEL